MIQDSVSPRSRQDGFLNPHNPPSGSVSHSSGVTAHTSCVLGRPRDEAPWAFRTRGTWVQGGPGVTARSEALRCQGTGDVNGLGKQGP